LPEPKQLLRLFLSDKNLWPLLFVTYIYLTKKENKMTERYSSSGVEFFAGLVIGGLVGAALALLMAPQSGEETRAQIRDKTLEYKGAAEESVLEARQRMQAQMVSLQDQMTNLQVQMGNLQGVATDALGKSKQTASEAYTRSKETVSGMVSRPKSADAPAAPADEAPAA
jgi:gas vesicle protein